MTKSENRIWFPPQSTHAADRLVEKLIVADPGYQAYHFLSGISYPPLADVPFVRPYS
jgi:hypothetical protein